MCKNLKNILFVGVLFGSVSFLPNVRAASVPVINGQDKTMIPDRNLDAQSENQTDSRMSETMDRRAYLASIHEQMSACLRSDRPIEDCRKEMELNYRMLLAHELCR